MIPPADSSALVARVPVVTPALASIVPLANHEEFYTKTTDAQRERIGLLLEMFEEIRRSPDGIVATCHRLALEHPGKGFSAGNIKTLYYLYKKTRDWRALVQKWRGGSEGLPAEFVQYFQRRVENNRSAQPIRATIAKIKAEWAEGKPIEGYGTWSEYYATQFPERERPLRYPFGFFPTGWSESTLYTYVSSKAERALARQGFHAAKRYLPHMVRSTESLRFLELLTIDDFETDIVVLARNPRTGRFELCTCTGLLALDVATRRRVGFGLKPRFKDEDGKRQRIVRADVKALLYAVYSEFGVPVDYGCTILCENAAAAITPDFETSLYILLGVQVARTGLLADKVLKNGFVEKGGKPWQKGWIESMFHSVHNAIGYAPGAKGANYEAEPGDLDEHKKYFERLLKIEGITSEQIDQLDTGFWKFEEALTAYHAVLDLLERRTDHQMEGFREICDFRSPDGSGLLAEAEAQKLPREKLLQLQPVPRMESPIERFQRITQGCRFVKPAEHALALLLLTSKRCVLKNHRITFDHLEDGYTYADADSPVMGLPEGTKLLGYFDAANPARLHCTMENGKYVGSVRRRGAVKIQDAEAIAAEQGEIARLITRCVLKPLQERHASEDQALAIMRQENEAKLVNWGLQLPDDGKKRGLTAQLASAQLPGRTENSAASASIAAGIAQDALQTDLRSEQFRALRGVKRSVSNDLLPDEEIPSEAPKAPAIPGADLLED